MRLILITFIFLVNLIFLVNTGYARDPNLPPPDYGYGEHQTVGGSTWDGGDTFIAIALPTAVVMLIALPHIFDGEFERWPVYKFALFNFIEQHRILYKFPTRSL